MDRPEDKHVKIPAVVHATRVGYTYLSIRGLDPGRDWDSDTNVFYEPFRAALERVNGRPVDAPRAAYLASRIRQALTADDLGRAFFKLLQTGVEGYDLIDFEHPRNNSFHVATELPYANGEDSFRPDVTFLVNGMPLAFMEAKRQNNKDGIQAERNRMAARFANPVYRRFANFTQVMLFSNDQEYDDADRHQLQGSYYASAAYGPLSYNHFREEDEAGMLALVAPRDLSAEQAILKDNNLASYWCSPEYESSLDPTTPANRIVTSLLSPERLVFLLRYGICYVDKVDDEGIKRTQKHVMRYPQLFATKAVRRTLNAGTKQGVVWHTQGSGKTALSFFLTRYLRDYYQARNRVARFFFIVDRLDLANQAKDEFEARGAKVKLVSSRSEFARNLKGVGQDENTGGGNNDQDRTPRITVVNIQKFDEEARLVELDYSLNVQRVYFIDEAHRDYKRGGAFLASLVSSDRDSVRLALTGTPLVQAKGGNNTRQVFGDYIHTYYYNQSIADGYTLKLLREDVKTEFRVKMQEVLRDLREVKKLVDMEPLTDYIVNDYLESQIALDDDTIGAMIVAQSAPQARLIADRLAELDPDVSSALILHNEGTKESRKRATDDFKAGKVNILVVFNMLLTGFDAHRLKKLYLCRPIKAHNLLQALTRVNRPYHDLAFGYVVDFADITQEYDKTNRAYLAELAGELDDAAEKYSSLFETPETVEADLARIRDVLFPYTTDNMVEFIDEIGAIGDKGDLYELRAALSRYKDLRNVARILGYEELYEQFDLARAREMLREVDRRIKAINQKEALALADMSTGAVNVILSQIEFTFRRVGTPEEMKVADEFTSKLQHTYGSFAGNIDQGDPEYVNLLDELRRRFEKVDIEEMTTSDMVASMSELDELKRQVDELNRRDAALAKRYGGDEKFARAHKRAMRTPPPLTTSPSKLHAILGRVKNDADALVFANSGVLGNRPYFMRKVEGMLADSCERAGLDYTAAQVKGIADYIATEYMDERDKAA